MYVGLSDTYCLDPGLLTPVSGSSPISNLSRSNLPDSSTKILPNSAKSYGHCA